jgi:hypothetical protein
MTMPDKHRELELSHHAEKLGFAIHKSRVGETADNRGGYQIVDFHSKAPVAGEGYDLDLDGVEAWLKRAESA